MARQGDGGTVRSDGQNFIKIRDIGDPDAPRYEFVHTADILGNNGKLYPIGYMKKVLDMEAK